MDTILYTLTYTNPSSVAVYNAILVDNLPPASGLSFISSSVTATGGVYNATNNTVTWNIPVVPPNSTIYLTYQAKASLESASSHSNTLVNHAQLNYPNGVVVASNTVTVVGDYTVHFAVYNESGELVKDLATFQTENPVTDFTVVNGVITSDSMSASFFWNGLSLGTWDATGASGGKVTNGNYIVKIDNVDPYGVTTSYTHTVTVGITRSTLEIAIYNEAGEVVKHFTEAEIEGMLGGSGGALLPADFEVGNVTLSSSNLSPSYTNKGGPDQTVTVTLGSGRSFTWDGKGDNGNILTTGDYFLEVESNPQGAPSQKMILTLHVHDYNAHDLGSFVLAPNPVRLDQTTKAQFMLNFNGAQVSAVEIKVYTMAGELMRTLSSAPGNPSMVMWDLSQETIASGAYFAVAELHGPNGIISRHVIQVMVLH